MCGIVGFVGEEEREASEILLEGLSKLEYRGYDSAGIAVRDGKGKIRVVKAKGRLRALYDKTDGGRTLPGHVGIGHTRWATHGEPSENNAHPHVSDDGFVTGVHNGIIENYLELKEKLTRKGYTFYSQTDTEAAVKLVDYYAKKYRIGPVDAISKAMVRMRGSYALALMFGDRPGEVWVARKDSPMIIGVTEKETYVASDVAAILPYTREVYYIGSMELACLEAGKVTFYDLNGDVISKETVTVAWDARSAEKEGYEHFMMKEIHEQPRAVRDTLHSVLTGVGDEARLELSSVGLDDEMLRACTGLTIAACGSAWHVGMALQYVFEDLCRLPVRVEYASEYRYRTPVTRPGELVMVISQSGETADSLAALREAKAQGVTTLALVNVVGSTIAREADKVFYTKAGPEIAVATTKAYSCQLMAGYCLAVAMAQARGSITEEESRRYINALEQLPDQMTAVLQDKERLQWFASKFVNARDVFFIGRGVDYAIALEGSLKMKEISYVHSEAYAAGELKHGTISLIEDGTLVIGLLSQPSLYGKTLSNMVECKARGAYLAGITQRGHYDLEDTADFTVYIPVTDPHFAGSLEVIPLQLIGYYLSCARGLDVDKPRNLAKSVTVE